MKQFPNTWELKELCEYAENGGCQAGVEIAKGKVVYVPARPLGFCSLSNRIKSAWLVFTGKADAVLWPHQ